MKKRRDPITGALAFGALGNRLDEGDQIALTPGTSPAQKRMETGSTG